MNSPPSFHRIPGAGAAWLWLELSSTLRVGQSTAFAIACLSSSAYVTPSASRSAATSTTFVPSLCSTQLVSLSGAPRSRGAFALRT